MPDLLSWECFLPGLHPFSIGYRVVSRIIYLMSRVRHCSKEGSFGRSRNYRSPFSYNIPLHRGNGCSSVTTDRLMVPGNWIPPTLSTFKATVFVQPPRGQIDVSSSIGSNRGQTGSLNSGVKVGTWIVPTTSIRSKGGSRPGTTAC